MADAPPSYDTVVGSSSHKKSNHLDVPGAHNGIPADKRRSMEDEHRPLPEGWVRQWDDKEHHQFFVDIKADPPRSTWVHPYDDETYLNTLSSEERERIQEEERDRLVTYDHTDDEAPSSSKTKPISAQNTGSSFPTELPARDNRAGSTAKKEGFAEKMKQKVTGQTKEERAKAKAQREEEERQYFEIHQKFRQAMNQAQMTGKPVWFARDPQGRDVYVEPPRQYGGAYGGGHGGYGSNGYGINPYQNGTPYSDPNARFIRPQAPYGRPYGGRPGGGYGMPVAGGLLGGMLLGGLLF